MKKNKNNAPGRRNQGLVHIKTCKRSLIEMKLTPLQETVRLFYR